MGGAPGITFSRSRPARTAGRGHGLGPVAAGEPDTDWNLAGITKNYQYGGFIPIRDGHSLKGMVEKLKYLWDYAYETTLSLAGGIRKRGATLSVG